ncbi:hypothetical protein AB0D00_01260 [Streptomyces sp. NPDC048213]|uniref:hypothetical protein n=1 Tax=Streptomyces sp. NPDC048213 TaxID=3160984 RepID=UPI003409D70F
MNSLARRHPGPLLDIVERQLAALPEPQRAEWWRRYAPGIAATAAAEPGGLAHGLPAVQLGSPRAGGTRGWTGPWRTQLRLLRRHPEAEVRDAAYAEVTVRE